MIPFYIFYSMFGFQRTGDQMWALGDARGRGLHDGRDRRPDDAHRRGPPARRRPQPHPRLDRPERAAPTTRPTPTSWRRSSATASSGCTTKRRGRLLLRHALQRELRPAAQARRASTSGILRGLYRFARRRTWARRRTGRGSSARARSCSRSSAARDLLAEKFGIAAEVYCAPSFPLLRRDALEAERWNRLHPDARRPQSRTSATVLGPTAGRSSPRPTGSKALPGHGRAAGCRRTTSSLGTDGFGRSDTREALRSLFEIDAAAHRRGDARRAGPLRGSPAAKAAAGIRELGSTPRSSTRSRSSSPARLRSS